MSTPSDDVEKAIRSLEQRYPLLVAWLEAMDRLEGPHCRSVMTRNAGSQRRHLIPSIERHPMGRRRPPHLVVVPPGPIRP